MTETALIAGCNVLTPLGDFERGSLLIRGIKLAKAGLVRAVFLKGRLVHGSAD